MGSVILFISLSCFIAIVAMCGLVFVFGVAIYTFLGLYKNATDDELERLSNGV